MDKYTKFILTMIAVALFGILFKGEINTPAHAVKAHNHYTYEIWDFRNEVKNIIKKCMVSGKFLSCLPY